MIAKPMTIIKNNIKFVINITSADSVVVKYCIKKMKNDKVITIDAYLKKVPRGMFDRLEMADPILMFELEVNVKYRNAMVSGTIMVTE